MSESGYLDPDTGAAALDVRSRASEEPVNVMLGNNHRVLCSTVDDAMIRGLKSSTCKVLLSRPGGVYSEVMLPRGYCGPGFSDTRCYMNLEATVPELRSLLRPREVDSIDRVNAYVSPARTGTPLHFDVRTVMIVQLAGTKLWKVSKTPATQSPHRNCVAPGDSEWVDYDGERLRKPNDFWVALLRPGDWLLVPKATWHETFTIDGSVSATLALPCPLGWRIVPRALIPHDTRH